MKKTILFASVLAFLFSCGGESTEVNESEYDKLLLEYNDMTLVSEKMDSEIKDIQHTYDKLISEYNTLQDEMIDGKNVKSKMESIKHQTDSLSSLIEKKIDERMKYLEEEMLPFSKKLDEAKKKEGR